MAQTIAISINASWNVINFRSSMVRRLQDEGYEVAALTPDDAMAPRLADLGVVHVAVPIDSAGLSPLADGRLLLSYLAVLRRLKPAVYLGYTIKPNVYGSLAAHMLGIPVINNVAGLGTAFIGDGWLNHVASMLYRVAFARSACVFFQNDDDRTLFLDRCLVKEARTALLPGSGVDLARFVPSAPATARRPLRFLLVARLLRDKGVVEYVAAARNLRLIYPEVRFGLLGFLDVANRTAISRAEVEGWVKEGVIDYLGHADDVRPHLAASDCVVLPSYREGLPRTMLEGAAMAKPLIATDVPGCRDVVKHGINGFLCVPRDAAALQAEMQRMIDTSDEERVRMGAAGRAMVEEHFDEKIVIERYVAAIQRALRAS